MRKILFVILLLLSRPQAVLASSAGADPFNFLFLDAGARPVALGGAYTALAQDANALLYNPAGLGEIKEHQAVFMHNQYFQGITQEYLSYASPQGWGVSCNYLDFGSTRRTTIANPSGTGLGGVGMTDMALSAGYGGPLSINFVGGAGIKFIKESVAGFTGQGFGLDLGVLYFPPASDRIVIGAAVQNIGPAVKFQTDKETMPLNMRLGAAYSFKINGQATILAFDVTKAREEKIMTAFGIEMVLAKTVPVRLGYNTRNAAGPGVTAGLGYLHQDLNFDYAFVPFGDLGAAHRLSVGYKWGDGVRKPGNGGATSKKPEAVAGTDSAKSLAEYERLIFYAKESAAKKDYARAAIEYGKALAIKSDDPQIHLAQADALMRTNRFKEADRAFAGALGLLQEGDSRRAYISERRGAAMLRENEPGAAKKHFTLAISLLSEKQTGGATLRNAYYGLAYCLEKESKTEEAMLNYRLALRLAGNDALKEKIEKRLAALEEERR